MDFEQINHIHFVGIGGIGVSALARLFLAMGKKITGSDLRDSQTITDLKKLGATIFLSHDAADAQGAQLVIYSEDITDSSEGFVELNSARKGNITTLSYAQALGRLMVGKKGIGVTGTNGKSTTAAMLGLILEAADMDPTVVIGTKISPKNESDKFRANARLGNSEIFVAEADEYHRHMLETHPGMIIVTNIAEDHLDYYKDLQEIKSAFSQYIKSLPADGILIYNADDHNAVEVCRQATCHKFTFGIHHYADLQAMNLKVGTGRQTFDLHLNDEPIGIFELQVPGHFNISNALGAALAAIKLGVNSDVIRKVLAEFTGTWRRFEKVGELSGKTIISDYGHHPAGVSGTIEAVKEFYPGKKILLVFQPHHRNRTKKLFGEFVEALSHADNLIVSEIFDVTGREHGEQISSKDLVAELEKLGVKAEYAKDLNETEEMIKAKVRDFDIVIIMGAGDIDLLARKLVKNF